MAKKPAIGTLAHDAAQFKESGAAFWQNVKSAFGVTGESLKGGASATGKMAGNVAGTFGTAAKQPVRWVVQGGRKLIQIPSYAFNKHPRLMVAGTVLAGVAIAGNALRGHSEKQGNEQLAQAQQNYMNSVTPAEAAQLAAAQQAGRSQQGGFAAAEQARAAAAQQETPAVSAV